MNELLAKHTGKPIEQIATDTERDYHMSGAEALAYGLIDKVVTQRQVGTEARGNGSGTGASGGQDA